jgi:hypothetical protein
MQRRVNEFTLEPINNIMMGSVYGNSNMIPVPPSQLNEFLLMTDAPFILMNGQDLLLMEA